MCKVPSPEKPVLEFHDAALKFGERLLWHDLNTEVMPGEFVAVLGPNGSGKTSLLKVLLGQYKLSGGSAKINGHSVHYGDPDIGYVPQQRGVAPATPLRATDLVSLGIDGHRLGIGWRRKQVRARVAELLDEVGATAYAEAPIGTLSGGELQRLRLAQALASNPKLLLCDEPLLSLDVTHQRIVASMLDRERRTHDTAILFVTHEINPILPYVDKVIYIAGGHFLVGTPEEVLTTEALTKLFGSPVEVINAGGRLVVVGGHDDHHHTTDPATGHASGPAIPHPLTAGGNR